MNEFDPETNEGFGLCAMEYPEWGYFSLDELAKEYAQEIVVDPPQTYEQLLETELRANLSSEELERVFYGKLIYEEDLWRNLPDEPKEIEQEQPQVKEPSISDEQQQEQHTTTAYTQEIGGIEVTTVRFNETKGQGEISNPKEDEDEQSINIRFNKKLF